MILYDETFYLDFFKEIKTKVNIPTGDAFAYVLNPKYNWVYNKIELCKSVGIPAYPHGIVPPSLPVYSKPVTNLWGMSRGARQLHYWDNESYCPGYLLMPVLHGEQYSIDYAIVDGEIKWHYSILAVKDENDSFLGFRTSDFDGTIFADWIGEYLKGYTGIVNIECIDDNIIEVHLRMSVEFIWFFGGKKWIKSVVNLYENKIWEFYGKENFGYRCVLRVPKEGNNYFVIKYDKKTIRDIEEDLRVNIIMVCDNRAPLKANVDNDEFTYRIALVTGQDKQNCEEAKTRLQLMLGLV